MRDQICQTDLLKFPVVNISIPKIVYIQFYLQKRVSILIIYMKKLLDSDWLRTVQFFLNTVQKRGNCMKLNWKLLGGGWYRPNNHPWICVSKSNIIAGV